MTPAKDAHAVQERLRIALDTRLPRLTAAQRSAFQTMLAAQTAKTATALPPLRTIHHFACTGGTLISKFLAATPNARLLSEIDPLSPLATKVKFSPLDLALQFRTTGVTRDEDLTEIFLAGLNVIYQKTWLRGERLILRDHSHSHYCTGSFVPDRPSVRDLIKPHYPMKSVVTVRHPLDSYLSVGLNKFTHFTPFTLEEYAARYLRFVSDHADIPCVRYEDFVADCEGTTQTLCQHLDLAYHPHLQAIIPAITLTGNSGRSGPIPKPRPRRELPPDVARMRCISPSYDALCAELEYEP